MRDAFAAEITALAALDSRIVLLSGDIGNRMFDRFKETSGNRFFNCGIAEANMISVAAGMAMNGLRPVAYTITPFITGRCLEQIRVDVCYHQQPVVLVGVGSGLGYADNGATHQSCEDIAWLRSLPSMTVVCPGDPTEVRLAVRAAVQHPGPVYLRLGKKGEPTVHRQEPQFTIGKAIELRSGSDVCLLSTGTLLPSVIEAAQRLAEHGVSARVMSFHTVKPLDEACLVEAFARDQLVVTVEEHSRIGGLGGAVAEWLADQDPQRARLLRLGTADRFLHEAGDQEYARKCFDLTPDAIARRTLDAYAGSPLGLRLASQTVAAR